MDSKKPLYKSMSFWIMVLFLLYSALGFLAVPYYIKQQFSGLADSELNSQLSVNKISFNPYTIAIQINGLSLKDKDAEGIQWFKADKVYANLDLWKTLFNYPSLADIALENPHYHLRLEHSKNGIHVRYPKLKNKEQSTNNKPLQLDVTDLNITKGSIDYQDSQTNNPLNLDFNHIQLHQNAFTTEDKAIAFDLSFTTQSDHNTQISGSYNLKQFSVNADWKIENWSTLTLLKLAGEQDHEVLNIVNNSGKIAAHGQINFSQSKPESSNVSIENLNLRDFDSSSLIDKALDIKVPQVNIDKAQIDLHSHSISVESIQSEHNAFTVGINDNYEWLWHAPVNKSDEDTAVQPWQFIINNFILKDSDLVVLKSKQQNNVHIKQLIGKNLSNINQQKSELKLMAILDETAQLNASSELQVSPFALSTDLQIDALNLKDWQAWMPSSVHIIMTDGLISTQQHMTVDASQTKMTGNLALSHGAFSDEAEHEFFAIDQLLINKNTIDFNDKNIVLDKVSLNHAQGDLLISEDKTLNLNSLVSSQDNNKPSGNDDSEVQKSDWTIQIKAIELDNGQSSITDKSIQPHYHSELTQVKGSIKGLSSQNLSKADVQLTGLLDTYAKLNISGQINPLSDTAFTDLSIDINNLDIQRFSPYSSRYLAFPIQTGKADFALKYKLNQHLLKGSNDLTFKQLKFGDKTDSEEAISLPLKLAVNLLTDGKGIMKIYLPVSGNIDDPDFSYGGLVFKAFFKLITGIVASPFKLLGKLIPNGTNLDLSGIQFMAGTPVLKSSEEAKLQAIQAIMQKRPNINLKLTPVINSIEDEKALKKQQLLTLLNLTETPDFNASGTLNSIKHSYIKAFNEAQWQQLNQQQNKLLVLEKAWEQLLASQKVTDKLNQLSINRAQYIQSQLIDQLSVPKERIFIQASESSESLYPQVKFGIAGL